MSADDAPPIPPDPTPSALGLPALTLTAVTLPAATQPDVTPPDVTPPALTLPAATPLRQTRRSLPIALLRAREAVMGPVRDMLASSGVNEQKWRVLRVLDEVGPLELTQLAAEACLLLPSLTRMVKPLQDEGLVARHVPDRDRRKVVLAITALGRGLLAAHAAESHAIFARIEAEFGAARLEALLDHLEALQKLDLRGQGQG